MSNIKFIEDLSGFLRDRNWKGSYKRLLSLSCFIVAVIITFTNQNSVLCAEFLAGSGVTAIATIFEKEVA